MKRKHTMSLAASLCIGAIAASDVATAQDYNSVQVARSPLVLKSQGSFFQDGTIKTLTDGSHITINQMYVGFMIPRGKTKVPVVMVHGGGPSGKDYETQPDGRMGWAEYFVRNSHPVFTVDQVTRGRSGFDETAISQVKSGHLPPSALPDISRTSNEYAWTAFRIGPKPGVPFPKTQFPINEFGEFSKQFIFSAGSQHPANFTALAELGIKLKGAVLLGHSESGQYPIEATLVNSAGISGMVMVEPACTRVDFATD